MRKSKLIGMGTAIVLSVAMLIQPVSAANWVHNSVGWWWQDNGHQSADGVNVEPILVSDEGYEYGAIDHWKSAKLLIGGQSELDSPLRIKNGNQFELSQEVIIE